MRQIIRTKSGTEYLLVGRVDGPLNIPSKWYLGALLARPGTIGERFLDQLYEIQEPIGVAVGERMVIYGVAKDFPSSIGWMQTSRVVDIKDIT